MYETYTAIIDEIAARNKNIREVIHGDIHQLLDSQRNEQNYPVLFSDDPVIKIGKGDSLTLVYDCQMLLLDTVESGNYILAKQHMTNLSILAKEIAGLVQTSLYNAGVDAVGQTTIDPVRESTPDNLIGWGIQFQFSIQESACPNPIFWDDEPLYDLPRVFAFTAELNSLDDIQIILHNTPSGATIEWTYQLDEADIIQDDPQNNSEAANSMRIQAKVLDQEGQERYATLYLRNEPGIWRSVQGKIFQ